MKLRNGQLVFTIRTKSKHLRELIAMHNAWWSDVSYLIGFAVAIVVWLLFFTGYLLQWPYRLLYKRRFPEMFSDNQE